MEQFEAEMIASQSTRVNDPVQAQQIYSKLSKNPELRMHFLANHADILANGVDFGGINIHQLAEIESVKREAHQAQIEADKKAYEQFKSQKAKAEKEDFWANLGMHHNDLNTGGR